MVKKPDSTIGERIKQIRKRLGLNQTRFGRLFSVSQEAISAWERGAYPDALALLEIAARGGTSIEWILTGNGNTKPGEEAGHSLHGGQRYEKCPLLKDAVRDGPPKAVTEDDVETYLWVPSIVRGEGVHLITMRDGSMTPILREGDIAAISEWKKDAGALHGLLVAAWLEDRGLTIRWLSDGQDHWLLYSENRSASPILIQKDKAVRFFRVVWWWGTQG